MRTRVRELAEKPRGFRGIRAGSPVPLVGVPLVGAAVVLPPQRMDAAYPAPRLVLREVVASSAKAESFAWRLAPELGRGDFLRPRVRHFVADGVPADWGVQRDPVSRAAPILDFVPEKIALCAGRAPRV